MAATDANGKPRATIRDVASAAGVSIATVSRVLNGRRDVAPKTREAVMKAVRDVDFATNRNARALSSGRTGLVGVTVPIIAAAYFSVILSGIAEALYEQDMRIVLCPTLHEHDREVTLLDRLMHGTTDGAILTLPEESNKELKALKRQGLPFVVVDPRVPLDDGIPAVSAGHAAGARAATEHLLSLGHHRIAAIIGPPAWMASTARLDGYRAAMAAAGVLPDSKLVVPSSFEIQGGEAAAGPILDLADRPTAIFAFNDNLAIGVLQAARAPRAARARGPLGRRLRRLRALRDRLPRPDDRAPAARRDGPDGGEPAPPPGREPERRDPPHRARDEARRAGLDGACAGPS